MKNRVKHIILMESFLDHSLLLMRKDYINDIQEELLSYMIHQLSLYYSSKQWIKDYDDYSLGLFPKDLRCGVLSQDAIYDLLDEYKNYKLNQ